MPKAIKYKTTYFDSGVPKFEEGKVYPVTEETARHVAQGRAEEVNVKAAETLAEPNIEVDPVDVDVA